MQWELLKYQDIKNKTCSNKSKAIDRCLIIITTITKATLVMNLMKN
jgi:hypothetical protein